MHTSPCEVCLLKSCCSEICDKQMAFTAERFLRLSKYMNLKKGYEKENEEFAILMGDIWDINQKICERRSQPMHYDKKFSKQRDIILEKMKNETPGINNLFCLLLFEKFDISL